MISEPGKSCWEEEGSGPQNPKSISRRPDPAAVADVEVAFRGGHYRKLLSRLGGSAIRAHGVLGLSVLRAGGTLWAAVVGRFVAFPIGGRFFGFVGAEAQSRGGVGISSMNLVDNVVPGRT